MFTVQTYRFQCSQFRPTCSNVRSSDLPVPMFAVQTYRFQCSQFRPTGSNVRSSDLPVPMFAVQTYRFQCSQFRPTGSNVHSSDLPVPMFAVQTYRYQCKVLCVCLLSSTPAEWLARWRVVYLVVEACAMMLPPIGFFGSAVNMAAPSTCATTWLVMTTATPNYTPTLQCSVSNVSK